MLTQLTDWKLLGQIVSDIRAVTGSCVALGRRACVLGVEGLLNYGNTLAADWCGKAKQFSMKRALQQQLQDRDASGILSCGATCAAAAAVPGSFLERFFAATAPMAPAERGAYLESPPQDAPDIEEAHQVRRGLMKQLSANLIVDRHVQLHCL